MEVDGVLVGAAILICKIGRFALQLLDLLGRREL
jgi:hypothetical protein